MISHKDWALELSQSIKEINWEKKSVEPTKEAKEPQEYFHGHLKEYNPIRSDNNLEEDIEIEVKTSSIVTKNTDKKMSENTFINIFTII